MEQKLYATILLVLSGSGYGIMVRRESFRRTHWVLPKGERQTGEQFGVKNGKTYLDGYEKC